MRPRRPSPRGRRDRRKLRVAFERGARRGPPSGECAITAIPSSSSVRHAPAQRRVVGPAERDLDGRDRRVRAGLVELRGSRSRARRAARAHDRRARRAPVPTCATESGVGRVQQVEVDREAVERDQARLAVGGDGLARASGTQAPPGLLIPPFVTIRARSTPPHDHSAAASSASLPGYARAVSNTVIPCSTAAAIVASAVLRAPAPATASRRMQPRPIRSPASAVQRSTAATSGFGGYLDRADGRRLRRVKRIAGCSTSFQEIQANAMLSSGVVIPYQYREPNRYVGPDEVVDRHVEQVDRVADPAGEPQRRRLQDPADAGHARLRPG